ncbi:hypothetical protein BU26DRAFT_302674 [Trematosphaeria pertusa]|uniref:DUF7702 domain-containing protein n=1 Tax=Trematosphaeria pertusa TaxID=390896 RepID=A0A6A6IDI4_9PLEO|nr:uncharacterized protein BU26DRAFT_302674 [Trematosphaeria pertusa]KAF2248634.1 hypothetical protein BU26DRAFT_302674 [Trematosphaeria pertusa]
MLGGIPSKKVDIPVTAVFLALYIVGGAIHLAIFLLNKKRGHKFLFSLFIFIFCLARIVTTSLRIATISKPTNIDLAIAASVFVAAGILILFIINLIWSQRVLRSLHPRFGWHTAISTLFRVAYVLIALTLAIVITATVQMFFTLRPRTRTIDRDLQLYAGTFFTIISFLPIPIVLIALAAPRKSKPEKFGKGRFRTKIWILLIGTTLCCLGAAFRCGTSWIKPVPLVRPMPDYYSKACFYIFVFTVEILVVYLYAIMRVDLRFHIPDGAKGPGSYEASLRVGSTSGDVEAKQAQETAAEGK